ncbi:MAG TPA: NYN domain-containing protein [Candidatus Paceibacterota bacterium]|nr:NYN domain-containing protein [Candidatus Paceibacterota bacterium]
MAVITKIKETDIYLQIEDQIERRVFVFIDASNLWEAQKAKGKMFDYEKLKRFLTNKFRSPNLKIFYYSAYPAEGTRDYSLDKKHQFFTYLKKGLNFAVIKKELKRISISNAEGQVVKEKGNMDVEITIDAVHHLNKFDVAVFFSGDSDFLALVTYLRQRNKQVFIFSSKNNISEELRTGGDGYFDVLRLEDDIWGRDLKHRDINT